MQQFHVRAYYQHFKGSRTVGPDESYITFVSYYTVNGVRVDSAWAEFRWAPFGELWLEIPPVDDTSPYLQEFVEFYESLTPEDCLEGSDFNFSPGVVRQAVRGIPVSTIESCLF